MTFRKPPTGETFGSRFSVTWPEHPAGSHWSHPRTGTDGARPFQWTQTGAPFRKGGCASRATEPPCSRHCKCRVQGTTEATRSKKMVWIKLYEKQHFAE